MSGHPCRSGVPFVKGHGTENDFVLLPDPDGTLEVTPAQVRALCDRHAGLGADGVIRVAPAPPVARPVSSWTTATRTARWPRCAATGRGCSPGIWSTPGGRRPGRSVFETRGGIRTAEVPVAGDVTIEMGPARLGGPLVNAASGTCEIAGVAVDVGNPHLVCLTDIELSTLDLCSQPSLRRRGLSRGRQHRVRDGRSGRTGWRCGCMNVGWGRRVPAVPAPWRSRPPTSPRPGERRGPSLFECPAERCSVTITDDDSTLTGPAVVVASGTIDRGFWERHRTASAVNGCSRTEKKGSHPWHPGGI